METATSTNTATGRPITGRKPNFHLSQLGNARRLVYHHGDTIRYCPQWKKWLVWDKDRWIVDNVSHVHQLAVSVIQSIRKDAKAVTSDDVKANMKSFASRSEKLANFEGMIGLAAREPGIAVFPHECDSDPMLFNCRNGVIDLRTGRLHPHSRANLLLKASPVSFEPDATCRVWSAFLERIFEGNQDLIRFLQRALGYALTGKVGEKALFFLYGSGDNGKTTLIETFRYILGDYAGAMHSEALMKKSQNTERERAIADLLGKRFITSSEAADGEHFNEAMVKQLTGMGRLKGRHIYGSSFEFDPQFKLFIDANHKPQISGNEQAIWNRFRLIPFNVSIPKAEQDRELSAKLRAEAPGILAWAVKGCLMWQREGLGMPKAVAFATQEYREEMDPITGFLEDCCEIDPQAKAPFGDLYPAYQRYCKTYSEKALSQRSFGAALDRRGYTLTRDSGTRYRKGLRLTKAHDSAFRA